MNEHYEELPKREETIDELLEKISNLEKEKEQYLENLKRAKSDVLRIQSEYEEKFKEIQNIANLELIYHLLSVLDGFELALKESEKNEINKGFYLIYSQLKDVLEKFGLSEIEISPNQKFDPNFHEAIAKKKCVQENCSGEDEGLIVEILSKGYFFKGRLLRPSRVKIITHE